MSSYLLDANVISMLSSSQRERSAEFPDWLLRADNEGRLFLSAVSIHGIEKGIAVLDHNGARAKAAALRIWLSGLLATFADKILALDIAGASASGRLEAQAAAGGHPGTADAMIAGIAKAHHLTVVTRNARHFRPFDITVLSPDTVAAKP